jgi:cobalt-zinc-cadmium efflux system outer membrane protein
MSIRLAAQAAWVAALLLAPSAHAADRLSLDDAIARVAKAHPDLRVTDARHDVLDAELDRAGLSPPLVIGAGIESALGTGEASGIDAAELSLTLASVLERGGKQAARQAVAQSRIDALGLEREAKRLDLLAEVARRYLVLVAAHRQQEIARLDIEQRRRTVAGARRRLQAGASPESVVLTAEAALARAELDLARAAQRSAAARQHLAALWGEQSPDFEVAAADPMALPEIESFDALVQWLARTPELAQFASEQRIREARLQLARTEATADLEWQVGVQRLFETDDFALMGSVAVPLGARSRAQPAIRIAQVELTALELERESRQLSLYSTLAEAHGRYVVAQLEAQRLGSDVLPRLTRAEQAAERAYHAGAISYLEWAQLQSERTSMRRQQLDAALEAQRALIEIQRLTGQAFVAGPAANDKE